MFDENGFDLTKALERVDLNLSAFDLLTLYGQLCLALRHPNNGGEAAEHAQRLATKFEEILLTIGMISKEGLYLIRTTEAAFYAQRPQEAPEKKRD